MATTDSRTAHVTQRSTGRVNNNSQGWGIAGAVIMLAILVNAWIFWVHKSTWKNPVDPTNVTSPAAAAH